MTNPKDKELNEADEAVRELRRVINPERARTEDTIQALRDRVVYLESRILDQDKEAERWQDRIENIIMDFGLTPKDPAGGESGDPLDWSADQVEHAMEVLADEAYTSGTRVSELIRALEKYGHHRNNCASRRFLDESTCLERCPCDCGLDEVLYPQIKPL